MKAFSICGYSDSGKTATVEHIIRGLTARGYTVGSVKEIHAEGFALDGHPASDTARQRAAGAGLVTARGLSETDVLFPGKLDMRKILSFYEGFDYVVCESVRDLPMPMIVTAGSMEDLEKNWNDFAFCVSGRIADELGEYRGVPAISVMKDPEALVSLIEGTVYEALPNVDPGQCGACGGDCRRMGARLLRGEAFRGDCVAGRSMEILVDGSRIGLVPFVEKAFQGVVLGFVRELKGYRDGAEVKITVR
ncbi:MAG: molybdopterin-guanine dinucleotide biosynthesis protein MobB [Clostridiales bacterium]|nr:molybdopterin-guanine dinucleotide biosynthesis protein MobB [Clostridiales bacterium]